MGPKKNPEGKGSKTSGKKGPTEKNNTKENEGAEAPTTNAPTGGDTDKREKKPEPTGILAAIGSIFRQVSSRVINLEKAAPVSPEMPQPAPAPTPLQPIPSKVPVAQAQKKKPPNDFHATDVGLPFAVLDAETMKKLDDEPEDKEIGETLSLIMDHYRGELQQQARKARTKRYPKYTYTEIVSMLTKQGIPVPSDDDFARLEATHGTKWDPDGTIVEYYSPVLRSFVPINMRGRYRGCWTEDYCIQGLDLSKISPKPDAIEGFVDRNRQSRIQDRYDEMSKVACNEAHLDYLIEMQKQQADILPLPIFYEVLNLGAEVLNENLEILSKEEGLPPNNRIYKTTEEQALHVHKKLQLYAALGMEPLDSTRKGLGNIDPQWEKTRDQMISCILARRFDDEYQKRTMVDLGMRVSGEIFSTLPAPKIPNINPPSSMDKGKENKGPKSSAPAPAPSRKSPRPSTIAQGNKGKVSKPTVTAAAGKGKFERAKVIDAAQKSNPQNKVVGGSNNPKKS